VWRWKWVRKPTEGKVERETEVFIPGTTDRIEFIYRFANDSLNDE